MFGCSSLYKASGWFCPNEKEDEKEELVHNPIPVFKKCSLSHTNTRAPPKERRLKSSLHIAKSWTTLCLKTLFRRLWKEFKKSIADGCMITDVEFFSVNSFKKSCRGSLSL